MFMISLTILFLSGMSRFMDEHVKKLRLLLKFAMRVLSQLLSDLWAYYSSPYPLLLVVGVLRRIIRRANTLWLAKGRGRPSVGEDVVELILDMKRSNWTWGALRISQELLLLGIHGALPINCCSSNKTTCCNQCDIKSGSTLDQTAVTWPGIF